MKFIRKVYNTIDWALSARDYDLHTALEELVDNAVANPFINTKGEPEKVSVYLTILKDKIVVLDDALGQSADGLADAWSLGKPNNKGTSKFGIGLKQASFCLGSKVTIETKRMGEQEIHVFHEDMERIRNNVKLVTDEELEITEKTLEGDIRVEEHFFKVTMEGIYKRLSKAIINEAKRQIGECFSSDIQHKRLSVHLRTDECRDYGEIHPAPPRKHVYEEEIKSEELGITGKWGIAPKYTKGQSKRFGADTFYNDRLITQSDVDIIKARNHPESYRLDAQIYFSTPTILDENLVAQKTSWVKNEKYYKVRDWLYENVTQKFIQKQKNVSMDERESEFNKRCGNSAPVFSRMLRDIFTEARSERKKTETTVVKKVPTPTVEKLNIEEEKIQYTRQYTKITIDGIKYNLLIQTDATLLETAPRFIVELNEEKKEMIATINLSNPYIHYFKNNLKNDIIFIELGVAIIEGYLRYGLKLCEVEHFVEEREEKLSIIDWIDILNNIDIMNKMEEMNETPEDA